MKFMSLPSRKLLSFFANFLGYGKVIEITLLPFDKEWLALKVERILTEEQTQSF